MYKTKQLIVLSNTLLACHGGLQSLLQTGWLKTLHRN